MAFGGVSERFKRALASLYSIYEEYTESNTEKSDYKHSVQCLQVHIDCIQPRVGSKKLYL